MLRPAVDTLRKAGLDVKSTYVVGTPGIRIAHAAAAQRVDLIGLGSHGRGAFKAAVLGSVATRVAARCTTPLLLIRRA